MIDSKNMLRACREEDIICSQIEDIIPSEERRSICELLSFQIDKRDCWKGEISSDVKGKGQNTIKTTQKNTVKNRPKKWGWNSKYLFYLLVIAALTAVALAVYCCHSCSQRKRQIRYL